MSVPAQPLVATDFLPAPGTMVKFSKRCRVQFRKARCSADDTFEGFVTGKMHFVNLDNRPLFVVYVGHGPGWKPPQSDAAPIWYACRFLHPDHGSIYAHFLPHIHPNNYFTPATPKENA